MEWIMQGSDQVWSWVIASRATAVAAIDLAHLDDDRAGGGSDIRRHPPFNKRTPKDFRIGQKDMYKQRDAAMSGFNLTGS
jgi:hypothetical protein